jgi:hypothetical protein
MPKFLQNERWLTGPAFLLQPEEKWPVTKLQNVPETSLDLVGHMKSLDLTMLPNGSSVYEKLRGCRSSFNGSMKRRKTRSHQTWRRNLR